MVYLLCVHHASCGLASHPQGSLKVDGHGVHLTNFDPLDRKRAQYPRQIRKCGVDASEEADGFVVRPSTVQAAVIDPHDDHRLAMAFALLGLRVPGIEISDPECVAKTFPNYFEALGNLRR